MKDIREVSKSRADTMPYGALVLERLMEHSQPDAVEISVYGVREGLLYSKLPRRKRDSDALLSSCWDFARRYARSPEHELELCDWTDQLFGEGKLRETPEQRRLRYAACLLADIGWRPSRLSRPEISGHDFAGGLRWRGSSRRVFLALTIFYRYEGESGGRPDPAAR